MFAAIKYFFSILILGLVCDGARLKYCKFDNLAECFTEPLLYFSAQPNGTGIPTTDSEFEQFCFNFHDYFPYCVRKWTKRCGTSFNMEVLNRFLAEPMEQSMHELCQQGPGKFRYEYLKHVQCIVKEVKLTRKYRETCIRDLQANTEWVHEEAKRRVNYSYWAWNTCCVLNQWEDCIVKQISEKCGRKAGELFPTLIYHMNLYAFKTICHKDRFDPNDPHKCPPDQTQAPKDYVPVGFGSGSLYSHFFSTICSNVGYGIDKLK